MGFVSASKPRHNRKATIYVDSVPVRKKINYRLELLYLAISKYFVIANYGKFGALSQPRCLGYFCCLCDCV